MRAIAVIIFIILFGFDNIAFQITLFTYITNEFTYVTNH